MKITLGQVFIAILLTGLSYASNGKAQAMLNKQVTIAINNSSLSTALKNLEKSAGVKFVYSKSLIKTDKVVTIDAQQQTLSTILDKLLTENGITYEVVNDRIVLIKAVEQQANETISPQAFPVTGKVVDETGLPLPGVTIRLNNTTRGTTTDAAGAFTINVDADTDVLTFSFIGYENQSVTVGTNRTLSIQMKPSKANTLQEVVVVGYGTSTRENLSTSVGSVKGESLRERPSNINFVQGIAGRVAGVSVMTNSGKPGGNPSIKIRGVGSLYTSSDPLYVVDGFVGANPQNIDPNIIETTDILKDAAATAIYGSRGANGVVIITTRKGKANTSEISFNNTVSFGTVARDIKTLDAYGAAELKRRQYDYVPGRLAPHLPDGADFARKDELFDSNGRPLYNTNWVDESTRTAVSNNHSLSLTGGTDKINITANVNFRNNQGLLLNSYEKRISGFINVGWKVKDWLDVQASITSGGSKANNVDLDPFSSTAIRKMYEFLPFLPVKYADGTWSRMNDYPGSENSENPVRLLNQSKNTVGGSYSNASFIGTFHLTKQLDLVTQWGGQTEGRYDFYYAGRDLVGVSQDVRGKARRTHTDSGGWTSENYLSYKNEFGLHNLNVVAGASWYYYRSTFTTASSQDFFDDFFSYDALQAGAGVLGSTSGQAPRQLNSYFGRVNYNFDSRYLLGASIRYDGASPLGANKKLGYFPAFSAGWNIANEEFFKGSMLEKTINSLKLRASYGVTGQSEIPGFSSLLLYSNVYTPFNLSQTVASTIGQFPNANLGWESSKQTNVGLEVGMFNNRLNVTIDYYNKVNSALLFRMPLPITTGKPDVWDNIGTVRNRGVEIGVNSVNIDNGGFRWNTTANFTMNRSKVIELGDATELFLGTAGHTKVGRPINEFYGFVRQGVWGTDEALEAKKFDKLPGDTKWLDANGNGKKDLEDRQPLGTGAPKWEANLINTFSYKGVTLMVDLQSMYGLSLINFGKHLMQNSSTAVNSFEDILNAWTPSHQNTMVPALRTASDPQNPSEPADSYAVEDASFLRVRNIGLSYRLDASWLQNIKVKNVSIGINVENAFLFTKYSGFDPEYTSLDAKLDQGVDIYQYPKPRTISLSLNANF